MNKRNHIIFIVFAFFVIGLQAQNDLNEEIKQLDKELDNPAVVAEINHYLKKLDTLSVSEIKEKFVTYSLEYPQEKKQFIEDYNRIKKGEVERFKKFQKHYNPDEEVLKRFPEKKLFNDGEEKKFQKIMQDEIFFEQEFENDRSEIHIFVRNKLTMLRETKDGTYKEFLLGEHVQMTNTIEKIYYHDSIDTKPHAINGPLNRVVFRLGLERKRIDSIAISFDIKYLTKVDSVRFTQKDIGKEKMGIKVTRMDDNIVEYLTSHLDYNRDFDSKNTLLDKKAYNTKHKQLEEIRHISDAFSLDAAEEYANRRAIYTEIYKKTKDLNSRKKIYTMLKYIYLKYELIEKNRKKLHIVAYEGNVNAIQFYLENKRGHLSFNAIIENKLPKQAFYTVPSGGKTQFIDNSGKVLYEFSEELRPVTNTEIHVISDKYFYDFRNRIYYFIDLKKKKATKLLFKKVEILSPSLLVVENTDFTVALRNNFQNKNLTRLFHPKAYWFAYFDGDTNKFFVSDDNNSYFLYDQDGQIITSETIKSITNIKLKRIK